MAGPVDGRVRTRRAVLGCLAVSAAGTPFLAACTAVGAATTSGRPAPQLLWNPNIPAAGLDAFEGVEDDRAHSEPGVKHIYVVGDAVRVDMHRKQRDTIPDRQRNEVKGMRAGNSILTMGLGDTWRLTYDLYLPSTLHGTDRFTHIFQLKRPGDGTTPLVTLDLRRGSGGTEEIALTAFATGSEVASAPLAPLRDHWISLDMTYRIGPKGAATFVIRDGAKTVTEGTRSNIDIWLGDRIRPKWGIYRSVLSNPADIIDTYLMLRNFKGYQG